MLSKNGTTSNSDSRYLPRWEVKNRVLYSLETDERPKEARTKDISGSGLCILTKENVTPLQKIQLTIHLSDGVSVKARGHVVWVKPSYDQNHIGVSFHEISDKVQDLILQHAFEFNKSQVLKHWFNGWDGKK